MILWSKKILYLKVTSVLFNYFNFNSIRKTKGNRLVYNGAFLKKTKILICKSHNTVMISRGAYLKNCSVRILGQYNSIFIGKNCRLQNVELHIEDNKNEIFIGDSSTFAGLTHLACIEGTRIFIGMDCMFSKDIVMRTGDSHSILDMNSKRINNSKDITIGDHVWIGNKVIVTKGVSIGNNCIVGTGSVVSNKKFNNGSILAGVPAKMIKENITWIRERI